MNLIDSTPEFVAEAYRKMEQTLESVRSRLNRPLTLAEKIMLAWAKPGNSVQWATDTGAARRCAERRGSIWRIHPMGRGAGTPRK